MEVELLNAFDASLDDFKDVIEVAGYSFYPSEILRKMEPDGYAVAYEKWLESFEAEELKMEFAASKQIDDSEDTKYG